MGSLEQDFTTVPGQLYACISLVGPDCPQKNEKFGLKIRGCFNSRDEAASHARRLQREDATFDIYVVDMYKWLLIPPDRDHIEDVHYNDDKLEEIMSKYRENQAMASKMFEERKRDLMSKPTGVDMPYIKPGDENSKYYTKPDEAPISHPADIIERLQKERPDASMEELVKEADAIVSTEIEERKKAREKELETVKEAEDEVSEKEKRDITDADDNAEIDNLVEEQKKADKEDLDENTVFTTAAKEERKRDKKDRERARTQEFKSRMEDNERRAFTDSARKKGSSILSNLFGP